MTPAEEGHWRDLVSPAHVAATATVSLGVVLFAFNAFVVATALPVAVRELGGGGWIAWATSLYLILAIVTGTAAAAAMHRLGARRLFVLAALVFLGGTLMAALAPTMAWLLAGRALQGAGAGFIEAGCYVLIPRLFPSRLIAKVFGAEAVIWALAAFGGPALAGWLATAFSWRVALLAAVPMALIFLALVPLVVRATREAGPAPGLPVLPLAGVAAGMTLVLISDSNGPLGWRLGLVFAGFAVFVLARRLDRQGPSRLLPKAAFRLDRAEGLGLWVALLMPLSQVVETVFLTYALQVLWGYSPLASGLASSVLSFGWSGAQVLGAHLRLPRIRLIWAGAGLLVAGQGLMALAFWGGNFALMLAAQAVIGGAMGANWGALSQVVMESAEPADRDVTSALLPTVMAAGYGIGAALFGLIANGLGFEMAGGEALRGVVVAVFALSALPAALALVAALAMSARLRLKAG